LLVIQWSELRGSLSIKFGIRVYIVLL
jgi:hypothetical protein